MLSIVILALLVVVFCLIVGKRNYVVVRSYMVGEDGKERVVRKDLKKFWRIEDALKFIDEYDWYSSDTSLNLMNLSRKDGNIKVNGVVFNSSLVYFKSADGSCEGLSFASQIEREAVEKVLGYIVSEEA